MLPHPGVSWASSEATRASMRANRGRDTKPELAVRSLVHRMGLRYRVDYAPLQGLRRRADLVFTRRKIAVFIDGCFWHGCPDHWTAAATNTEFWVSKVVVNTARDRDTDARLGSAGWTVLRFWEHEDPQYVADSIGRVVRGVPSDRHKG